MANQQNKSTFEVINKNINKNDDTNLAYPVYKDIISFVNPKSGGQSGKQVYENLKRFLSESKVFDLSKSNPRIG